MRFESSNSRTCSPIWRLIINYVIAGKPDLENHGRECSLIKDQRQFRTGLWYALAAYGAWGLVPLYFRSAVNCPAHEIVAHRILWSCLVLALIIIVLGRVRDFFSVFSKRSLVLLLIASGYLVAANWYVYVYSATSGQITQASLGYFLLPLVNSFIGVVYFRERLNVAQGFALALAGIGVAYMAFSVGSFPWIGITLAVTFSIYGVLRKLAPVDSVIGLAVETVFLSPAALLFLLYLYPREGLALGSFGLGNDLIIACSGLVTTFPLICFTQAIRRVPLVSISFLQYLSPTFQLLVAIFVYNEAFTHDHAISFGAIWIGLLIFGWDMLRGQRVSKQVADEKQLPEINQTELEMKKATA